MNNNDNIAAIATGMQNAGIAIIKISGFDIEDQINNIFKGKNLRDVASNTINYGYIYDGDKKIDEVLVSVMRAPHTHTGEDIIEINTHGGILITQRIFKLVLMQGIRQASPGEFSKRAYLNGKISLLESENIINLIEAKNEMALDIATHSFSKETENLIISLREELLSIVANIEVNIDYPEYEDIKVVTENDIQNNISNYIEQINNIISDSKKGELFKHGIKTAIVGKPNVGKSSLLNKLSRDEKAIVTNIEGTTRDIVESTVNIGGITLNLFDTAGIRETADVIEKIGIKKSLEIINKSEFILFVIDGSKIVSKDELTLYKEIKLKKHLVIINKSDIGIHPENLKLFDEYITSSMLEENIISTIENKVLNIFDLSNFDIENSYILPNYKHIINLENVNMNLNTIKDNLKLGIPLDLIEIDLKDALFNLGEILGLEVKENLLDELFSRFCLGK